MYVRFEVLTAVVMKSSILWDTMPCIPLKLNQDFGRIYRLCLQDRRIIQGMNQREVGSKQSMKVEAYS
jgi:hypothetical protein